MPSKINEVGNKYGRVTVIRETGKKKSKRPVYEGLCDCGTRFEVLVYNLKNGNTRSCGCYRREYLDRRSKEMTTHGKSGTPEYERSLHLRRYGMTQDGYDRMLEACGGRCQICLKEDNLHVDHDHLTGKVRGLLCPPCNKALGLVKDNVEILKRALEYLETFSVRPLNVPPTITKC